MKQHRFDPVGFIFGLVFLGIGLPMLFSGSVFSAFQGRWLFPAILIVAGAVVLVTTRRHTAQHEDVLVEQSGDAHFDELTR